MSGWEPSEYTEFFYDGNGQLIGAKTYREPEWCQADVSSLLAYVESQRLGSHGQPMSEAISPLADPSNPEQAWDYEVSVYMDFAQRRLEQFQKAFRAQYGDDADSSAYRFIVKKKDL
ncbi:hypothetical protein [Canibacter oris]|uniref:S-methylmethionine-dependent homocysteine/selenocysteine methylase n=1 Tax=Canibacter oris TaxID=1365628 RepID=A0A840DG82_9MICO|nr:hypothetical protein [Canibacter oris]MBB4072044.1 S-methylmethionine-dependent homocysteine/selenocysteine methylase [Canibacter oris]